MASANSVENFFKAFDMYGQSANFSYMGKSYFSTTCGGCISIVISILLIYYFIVLVLEMVVKTEVFSITYIDYNEIAPEYNIKMDSLAIFNNTPLPPYTNLNGSEAVMQMSIGIMDQNTMMFRPIDPRYFNLNVFMKETIDGLDITEKTGVFFDLCTRFRNFDNEFTNWDLNETYCIYSNVTLRGSNHKGNFSYLTIDVNKCSNDTLYYLDKQETESYIETYGDVNTKELNNDPNNKSNGNRRMSDVGVNMIGTKENEDGHLMLRNLYSGFKTNYKGDYNYINNTFSGNDINLNNSNNPIHKNMLYDSNSNKTNSDKKGKHDNHNKHNKINKPSKSKQPKLSQKHEKRRSKNIKRNLSTSSPKPMLNLLFSNKTINY